MPLRRLFHTSLSHRTSPPNFRSPLSDASPRKIPRGLGSTFYARRFLPHVPDPSLRYFSTRLCRLPRTVSHLMMPPPNYRSRSSSSGASSPMTLQTAKPRHRHIAMLAAPHLHNPLTLLRFAVPAAPATPATVTRTLRLHACHHSRLRVSSGMPVSTPHMVYLLKQPWCGLVCVHPSQSRPHSHTSVPPSGNTSCAFSYHLQDNRPGGNPPCHRCRPSCGTWTFSKAWGPGSLHGQIWPSQT